jgi:hypothetical protein
MSIKIERVVGRESEIVLRVCGRLHIECVHTLKELIETENAKTVLDLSEVTLNDRDGRGKKKQTPVAIAPGVSRTNNAWLPRRPSSNEPDERSRRWIHLGRRSGQVRRMPLGASCSLTARGSGTRCSCR